jgi:hypothetical protein
MGLILVQHLFQDIHEETKPSHGSLWNVKEQLIALPPSHHARLFDFRPLTTSCPIRWALEPRV